MKQQQFLGPPIQQRGGVQCMSLACEHRGGCAPIGQTATIPRRLIYPPDCSTGLVDPRALGNDAPPLNFGNDMASPVPVTTTTPATSSNPLASVTGLFEGMSTTTMLVIAGAAYFLFFRKKR